MATKTASKRSQLKSNPEIISGALSKLENENTSIEPSVRRQYVTFIVANEAFAVDMAPVQEIIRVPDIVSVPLAPSCLLGLANLRGKVLPIVSLRFLFSLEDKSHDDSTRAVVINYGQQQLSFVVDRVTSVIEIDPESLESSSELTSTVDSKCLSGVLKNVGEHPMVMVLDFEELIKNEFEHLNSVDKEEAKSKTVEESIDKTEIYLNQDEFQLVSFKAADQEYAISIEHVQEIVQMPSTIIHIPHTASHVLGVMTLRQRLLPLVSLRVMFGLPIQAANDQSRVLVVSVGEQSIGLVTDSVNEVLRISKNNVDQLPSLLANESNCHDISQICRLDGGKRLVSVISTEHMFKHENVMEVLSNMDSTQIDITEDSPLQALDKTIAHEIGQEDIQVVIFTLNKEEFGVPIEAVQEIVRIPETLTHVPKTPEFVEGVINLRGSVLPVIDQRRRLGMETLQRNDHQRIMVFMLNGIRTGFIVDTVTEVLKIHANEIEPAPKLSGEQAFLISRIANLEKQKRMIQLIDPEYLLADAARNELKDMELN